MVERYIEQQPLYKFLEGDGANIITSQGIILALILSLAFDETDVFSDQVQRLLKGIYFQIPSRSIDRGLFLALKMGLFASTPLPSFGIPCFWVDPMSGKIFSYVEKHGHESGLFCPLF